MDGESNGKAYFLVDDLGVPLFLETSICCKSGKVIRYPTEVDQIRNTETSIARLSCSIYVCIFLYVYSKLWKPQDFQIKHPKAHVPHTEFGCSSWAAVDAIAVRHQLYIYLATINWMNMTSMIYTQFVTQFVSLPVCHWHISCFNMQTVQGQLLDNGLHPIVFCGVPWGRIHDSKSEHSSLRNDWHCLPGMILPTEWLNPGCQRRKNGITTSSMDVHWWVSTLSW